jgi:predicted DsbA family dithiol-disulfide isomerase
LEKEVNTLCDDARSRGITGVPMTIIDGKWAVSGVQSADVFIQVRSAFPRFSARLTLCLPPG